uniref:Collagen triple helix repeat protein n=1 Tax=Pithovirus LCPAC403 TaxID=2506596 RepID=A0A481ZCY1_9VIRU|nr:MAG: hypothetical protein LCPAC403_00530 [Pithovirus LCPAC403]
MSSCSESSSSSECPPPKKGCRGPKGPKGPKGCSGKQGCRGPKGCRGSRGDKGSQGSRGSSGSQGPAGPQGPQGMSSMEFPFVDAYETVAFNATEAWFKASDAAAPLGSLTWRVTQILHKGKNGTNNVPLFQNLRITSKEPDSNMEVTFVFYEPYTQLLTATAVYNAGDVNDQLGVQGQVQTLSVDNNNNRASFHLQDLAVGSGMLYLTFNINPLLV